MLNSFERQYDQWKKEDTIKPKPIKLNPTQPISRADAKKLLKLPRKKNSWINRPLKKELILELAELLDCNIEDFGNQWVTTPLIFIEEIVNRLNKKLSQQKI